MPYEANALGIVGAAEAVAVGNDNPEKPDLPQGRERPKNAKSSFVWHEETHKCCSPCGK